MKAGCLEEATILAFLDAKLPEQGRLDVERHVAACVDCADILTWAAADLAAEKPAMPVGPLQPGTRVDRYQILEAVGRGGMGEVYAAYHPDLDRRIALKVVDEKGLGKEDRRARLLREAKAIARLSHPNVIAVYDAGTFDDRVYVAMEFIDGQTIDAWLAAAPRSWREILSVFVAAGRGLSAAHAAGIVHRDFKPQNVMIARSGAVRVMDFGLARLAGAAREAASQAGPAHEPEAPSTAPAPANVTRAGTVMGTPAYMAPEQFRGDPVDARSNQFSFCVALFEALSGERPFRGENILSLSLNVTEGDVETPAKLQAVPAWVRRPILRGLRPKPAARHPSMDALIDALAHDPAVRSRRRLLAIASVVALVAGVFAVRHVVAGRQQAVDARVSALLDEAAAATRDARGRGEAVRDLRARAFAAFDAMDRATGESLWRQSLSATRDADRAYERAEQAGDAALVLDPSRTNLRDATAKLLSEHLALAEQARSSERAQSLATALAAHDVDGAVRRQRAAPGSVSVRVQPAGAAVVLQRYERDPVTRQRVPKPVSLADRATATDLPAGSYRLSARAGGHADAFYPFTIEPKEHKTIELTLPPLADVPEGFVYVPAGEFLYGEADEQLRTQFLNTSPIHRRRTDAYLIAANETTYRDWIDFLSALPPAERARHSPSITTLRGELRLRQFANHWQLSFRPTTQRYAALLGESFSYVGRKERARQDWSRFPVAGVSSVDIGQYLRWLSSTRRVPGARLCSEIEWERAARGADERLYPHGDELSAEDANFDITYDRTDGAYGPDEIGSHPASRSPFGVDDLAGNVYELVTSSMKPGELLIRGGAYYYGSVSARVTNREPVPASFSDITTGIRVCADARK